MGKPKLFDMMGGPGDIAMYPDLVMPQLSDIVCIRDEWGKLHWYWNGDSEYMAFQRQLYDMIDDEDWDSIPWELEFGGWYPGSDLVVFERVDSPKH